MPSLRTSHRAKLLLVYMCCVVLASHPQLFSATQTKSVKDLARLSLSHPEYISVHEESKEATPPQLTQAYSIVSLENKIDVLFSFMRTHLQAKTLVFVSSCKQVRRASCLHME